MTKTKKKIIAGVLTLTMGAAFVFVGVSPLLKDKETADVPHYNQIVITPNESYGVELMSATIDPVEYETYGISEQAESAQSVTAVMTPEGSFTVFDWSVAWSDSTDEFASGKTVTDYISVAATSDGANTATVTCYGEFGTQIVLTAQSRTNSALKATATIDYDLRFKGVGFSLTFDDTAKSAVGVTDIDKIDSYESANITMPAPNKITESGNFNFSVVANHGAYTTQPKIPLYAFLVKCSDSFASQLTSQGLSATTDYVRCVPNESNNYNGVFVEYTAGGMQQSVMDRTLLEGRFGITSQSWVNSSSVTYNVSLARLYGALSGEVMTTDGTAFTESLIEFVNAAKATSGYHFEICTRAYYGDTILDTKYYVTFSAETLVAVEPTSVSMNDTSLWF